MNPLSKLSLVILVFLFALGSMAITQAVRIHSAITASDEGILAYIVLILERELEKRLPHVMKDFIRVDEGLNKVF